jgi:hypothetical protein
MLSRRTMLGLSGGALALLAATLLLRSTASTAGDTLANVIRIAPGGNHTCALLSSGGVVCWGTNHYGELGDGTTTDRVNPAPVTGLSSGVAEIAAGDNHSCAVLTSGAVKCWGYNRYGQLGNGTATGATAANPTPVDVSGITTAVAITAGGSHTCALLTTGGVQCWGWNRRGQIGDGQDCSTSQCRQLVPTDVTGLASGVTAIDAGVYHNCAVLSGGTVKCWGQNDAGQLGTATGSPCQNELLMPVPCAQTPVDVPGISNGAGVTAGGKHTCALLTTSSAKCWGDNSSGQIGDGGTCGATCASPASVQLANVTSISAGEAHTCAIAGSAAVAYCWGDNAFGQLGSGDRPTGHATPVDVCARSDCSSSGVCVPEVPCRALRDVSRIALGLNHSCALLSSTRLTCWGSNSNGQLGDGQACGASCGTSVDVVTPKATPTPTATQVATATPTPATATGDANCDHSVNSIDAALVLQYSAGLIASLACQGAADVNHDGSVNAIDAALILQYVAGLIGSL